eukprot:TRINITY_DN9689_c0_g2_i3.p1 TRINITY_DN9689_c0_g2~~TRINITY_DN9689_c0_g2_i3.p1  ORF type:complete len:255 (+),score=33.55 TRINITY_DN9689_c0_g2_i3:181-945(+)
MCKCMSWNLWKRKGNPAFWPERKTALVNTIGSVSPNLLLVQELHPDLHSAVTESLPNHSWVRDTFEGWMYEGNIYWDDRLWKKLEHGIVNVGMQEPLRRLFWVRLNSIDGDNTLFVATAHFTWQGHEEEINSDLNLRKVSSRLTVQALTSLAKPNEPVIFGGDLNEDYWPRKILSGQGFIDCFTLLDKPCLHTHPARPTGDNEEDLLANSALDWLFVNNQIRLSDAFIYYDFHRYSEKELGASDHFPVVACFSC